MIELINEERHLSFTVIGAVKMITVRAKLKGSSFDGRQDTLRHIYNEHLLSRNTITYKLAIHSHTMEVVAVRNGVEKSVGFIPEEVTRVLWNNDEHLPSLQGVEVRKHIDKKDAPEFGATVRLMTNIPASSYMEVMKEFEASVLAGPTPYIQEANNATESPAEQPRTAGSSAGAAEEAPNGATGRATGG